VNDCTSSDDVADATVTAAERRIERGAKIVVFSCTGLSPQHIDRLRDRIRVPVIEPLAEAVQPAVAVVDMMRGTVKPP
jgi:Asp/Glu/hydantoin racemase